MEAPVQIIDWGRISYEEAWKQQKILVDRRIRDEISDTLIFCEHEAVITLGRGAQRDAAGSALLCPPKDIPIFEVERGGLATYHGPGQLVAYPIFRLGRKLGGARGGVVNLIRALEQWVVSYLEELGLEASSLSGKTGVWIQGSRKIASIGISARHWVSYHGLALNFATGAEPWRWINPCGFNASVMTDLSLELKRTVTYAQLVSELSSRADSAFRNH